MGIGDSALASDTIGYMDAVELGSAEGGRFTLTDPKRGRDGELWSVVASLEVGGLHAVKEVWSDYANRLAELVDYLSDLADHWKGWDGEELRVT